MSGIFLRLVNMSIAASWIVLVVAVLRLLLWRAPKWINCLLWAVVGLRLVMPFPLKSIFSLVPQVDARELPYPGNPGNLENLGGLGGQGAPNIQIPAPAVGTSPAVPAPGDIAAGQAPDLLTVLSVIWMVGCAVMLAYALISYLRLYRRVGASIRLRENIFVCDDIATPFLLGVFRPRVYLPSGISEEQLPYILAHERAHMKRKDHLWKPLGFVLLAVYWFNPVLWLAYSLFCRDIELACDEKVIRGMGKRAKRAYSQALLCCAAPRRMILISPLAFGEVGIKKRIKSVLYYKRPAFWLTLAAVVVCVVVGVCFLTDPYGTDDPPPEDDLSSDDALVGIGGDPDMTDIPGDDDPSPQVDVALIREIVFTYGAMEDTYNYDQPTIVMKNKSLFLRGESWSGENGLALDWYFYWEGSLPRTDEEWAAIEAGRRYAEEHQGESPFGYGYLGPGETVEEKILSHFEVTLDYLHSDPEYYDESIPGYFYPAGGGLGERPVVSFTWEQDGDILTIPVTLTSHSIFDGSEQEDIHTLTVRLELGGGWKYLGCQVA